MFASTTVVRFGAQFHTCFIHHSSGCPSGMANPSQNNLQKDSRTYRRIAEPTDVQQQSPQKGSRTWSPRSFSTPCPATHSITPAGCPITGNTHISVSVCVVLCGGRSDHNLLIPGQEISSQKTVLLRRIYWTPRPLFPTEVLNMWSTHYGINKIKIGTAALSPAWAVLCRTRG